MLFKGKPLIRHAIDILLPVCRKVVISSNHSDYEFTGCEVWPDELTLHAPLGGIYSCLKRSQSDWNIVFSCDMPLVATGLFFYMMDQTGKFEAAIPVHDEKRIEPLCGFYKSSVINQLEKRIHMQKYGVQDFLGSINCRFVGISSKQEFYHEKMFLNVNTPADLEVLKKG